MSTYIESGHAKNTANFDHLIALLLTYSTNYTPSTANLAITNLQTVLTNAQGALKKKYLNFTVRQRKRKLKEIIDI